MTAFRVVVLVAAGLLGAACSGGDGGAVATTSSTSTTSAAPAATTTTTAGPRATLGPLAPVDEECGQEPLEGGSISTVGFDEITFGMSVANAEQATGVCLSPDRPVNQECYFVLPVSGPEGIAFMVTEGTIERVDVFSGPIATRSGLGIGTTEAEVLELFGDQIEVRPHPLGGGNELVFVPADEADAEFRVVFETNGERVTRFRSGRVPQVDDPEGCS